MRNAAAIVNRDAFDCLEDALAMASGADREVDRLLAAAAGIESGDFTASISDAKTLVECLLPSWTLHLDYGATGMFPSATLSNGARMEIREVPTVPLAIIRAAWAAYYPPDSSAAV